MCGICGFWAPRFTGDFEATVTSMAETIRHRGPDAFGQFVDRDAGLALGHRRLSILDLSEHGTQPMTSNDGRWVITYNGEIYNYQDLDVEVALRSSSDTEVLVETIAASGVASAIERLNGMFAFAAWDKKDRTLHLVRDRLGIKPLYWGRNHGSVLFASELKPFHAFPAAEFSINRDAVAAYLRYNYIPTPDTIFHGVHKLAPGEHLTLSASDAEPKIRRYWSAADVARKTERQELSDQEAVAQTDRVLRRAVSRRMIADVPLGAFLSGGIDSSLVVALMQAQSGSPIKTFTIGFNEARYDEAEFAKEIAAHLGTDHTELYVDSQASLDVIAKLPTMYDEPFSDSSQIPTHLVSALAREHVTVTLSGDGADELFGGYNRHLWGPRVAAFSKVPQNARSFLAKGLMAVSSDKWEDGFERYGKLLPKQLNVRLPAEKLQKLAGVLPQNGTDIYRTLRSHWQDPTSVVLNSSDHRIEDVPGEFSMSEKMMLLDLLTYLPDDILTKVDRASMAVSLEARVPYLDHEVAEFAFSLPMRMKIRDGETKWVLRRVLKRYVPEPLWERPKMGFGVPIDRWLREDLKEYAWALLNPTRLRDEGMFDATVIRERWEQHQRGEKNWQHHLWDIVMFQAWYETQGAS